MALAAHYLKIIDAGGAPIIGESYGHQPVGEALQHAGEIDIKGWDWRVSDQAADSTSSKGKSSKSGASDADAPEAGVEVGTLTFHKVVDRSTTRLMRAMDRGEELQEATFVLLEELVDVRDQRGGAFRLHVILEKAVLVRYSLNGEADEHRVELEETWELSFSKITFAYESAGVFVSFDRAPGTVKRRKDEPLNLLELLKQHGIQPDRKRRVKRG